MRKNKISVIVSGLFLLSSVFLVGMEKTTIENSNQKMVIKNLITEPKNPTLENVDSPPPILSLLATAKYFSKKKDLRTFSKLCPHCKQELKGNTFRQVTKYMEFHVVQCKR